MKKRIVLFLVTISAMFAITLNVSNKAKASSYESLAKRSIVTTKVVKVFKGHQGKFEANNTFQYYGKIKKGTHLKVSSYYMSTGGYIVKSFKYNSHGKVFFIVPETNSHWFKKR